MFTDSPQQKHQALFTMVTECYVNGVNCISAQTLGHEVGLSISTVNHLMVEFINQKWVMRKYRMYADQNSHAYFEFTNPYQIKIGHKYLCQHGKGQVLVSKQTPIYIMYYFLVPHA